MAQQPLNDEGGDAARITLRLPEDMARGVILGAAHDDLSLSEFIRLCIGVELSRREVELAEACGLAMLPQPDGTSPPRDAA